VRSSGFPVSTRKSENSIERGYAMRVFLRLVLLLALLATMVSCSRFDHDFVVDPSVDNQAFEAFVTDFGPQVSHFIANGAIDSLMSLYTADYYNNGVTRDSLRNFYQSLPYGIDSEYWLEVTLVSTDARTVSCQLYFEGLVGTTELVAYWYDQARKDGEVFKMCGNGIDKPDHAVLVEMFTAVWCPNCPAASEQANLMAETYAGMVIPVEYIVEDPTHQTIDCSDIERYYIPGEVNMPCAVFDGVTQIEGGSTSTLAQYAPTIDVELARPFPMLLENLACSVNGTDLHISVDCTGTLSATNLYLKWAVLDETSDMHYSANGENMTNIVIAKGQQAHPGTPGNVSFDVTAPESLPADAKLVVWLQTLNPSWDSSCQVHNCAQTYIDQTYIGR
jgi:hypothetical protein